MTRWIFAIAFLFSLLSTFCGLHSVFAFATVMLITFQKTFTGRAKNIMLVEIQQDSCVLSKFSIFPNGSAELSLLLQILLTIGISLEL